jgi:hypothetical protein
MVVVGGAVVVVAVGDFTFSIGKIFIRGGNGDHQGVEREQRGPRRCGRSVFSEKIE